MSSVQGFASLQFRGTPPTHVPPLQVSLVVQALPSLQGAVLFGVRAAGRRDRTRRPCRGCRRRSWAPAPPTHVPPAHSRRSCRRCRRCRPPCCSGARSRWPGRRVVRAGVRVVAVGRRAPDARPGRCRCRPSCTRCRRCTGACCSRGRSPWPGCTMSFVHGLPSLQFGAAPPTHVPPAARVARRARVAVVARGGVVRVHAAGGRVAACRRCRGSRRCSSVARPRRTCPRAHVSPVVQALPSLHGRGVVRVHAARGRVAACRPCTGCCRCSWARAPPTQLPPLHVSFVVQALPSLHGAVLFVCTQPVVGLQRVVGAGVPVVARGRRAPDARPAAARVARRARVLVVARRRVRRVDALMQGAGLVRARVPVVAVGRQVTAPAPADDGVLAARRRHARVGRARVAVVTAGRSAGAARPAGARVAGRAGVTVTARGRVVHVGAARRRVAGVVGARVRVGAVGRRAADTGPRRAGVARRARVAVVARGPRVGEVDAREEHAGLVRAGVTVVAVARPEAASAGRYRDVLAADARHAAVERAPVAVVAARRAGDTGPAAAGVARSARVAVLARRRVVRPHAACERVARVVGARVRVVADGRGARSACARGNVAGLDARARVGVVAVGVGAAARGNAERADRLRADVRPSDEHERYERNEAVEARHRERDYTRPPPRRGTVSVATSAAHAVPPALRPAAALARPPGSG